MKVLISVYACEPGMGSEEGTGWKAVHAMAQLHDVWALTRVNNRPRIERELARTPLPRARFVYYDLPLWARWWKRGHRGLQQYYYLWQVGAYSVARRLHREIRFDLVHHVTFARHWTPCFLTLLDVPLIFGPVGGGESIPKTFWREFGPNGFACEALREGARWLAERDPFVSMTARRSRIVLASTHETAVRMRALGARDVRVLSPLGLPASEMERLTGYRFPSDRPVRFISIGNLFPWKGFHLGLRAFAYARLGDAEYWIIGDGPERRRLHRLADRLGIANQVTFFGRLSREESLERLAASHAVVFPSLRDSAGLVCLEAMALGRPVICFNLGGPPVQVTSQTALAVRPGNPTQAVRDMSTGMRRLVHDPELCRAMGSAARLRSAELFQWEDKARRLDAMYREAVVQPPGAKGAELQRAPLEEGQSIPGRRGGGTWFAHW